MKIERDLIPQADKLDEVINVLYAIEKGARSDEEITKSLKDINVSRQGRYYRKATEILGFTERNKPNYSELTSMGLKMCRSSSLDQQILLKKAVLSCQIIQRIIPFIENKESGFSFEDLSNFVFSVTDTTQDMAKRRTSTIISWLKMISFISKNDDNNEYFLNRDFIADMPIINYVDTWEPMIPHSYDLKDYIELSSIKKIGSNQIVHMIDSVKLERAINRHNYLVNLVAEKAKSIGVIPKSNKLIDLAITTNEGRFIFEMKSFTTRNVREQIRIGISQLYEYKYLQNAIDAKLALFIERKLPDELQWMQHYIENDRNIFLLWNENRTIHTTENNEKYFSFLIN